MSWPLSTCPSDPTSGQLWSSRGQSCGNAPMPCWIDRWRVLQQPQHLHARNWWAQRYSTRCRCCHSLQEKVIKGFIRHWYEQYPLLSPRDIHENSAPNRKSPPDTPWLFRKLFNTWAAARLMMSSISRFFSSIPKSVLAEAQLYCAITLS